MNQLQVLGDAVAGLQDTVDKLVAAGPSTNKLTDEQAQQIADGITKAKTDLDTLLPQS